MSETHIYQIYYSDTTREALVSGFDGLDNTLNARPDWREYWPIRNYILNKPMNADAFYGFFSPKFSSKTNLDSAAVFDFVALHTGCADVILFSPFFDQITYPVNMFEQGALQHADIMQTFRECVQLVAPGIDFDSLVMDSTNTVFCNYFVAKPNFWNVWLNKSRCPKDRLCKPKASAVFGRLLPPEASHWPMAGVGPTSALDDRGR